MAQIRDPEAYEGRVWDVGGGPENAVTVAEMAAHLLLDTVPGPPRDGDAMAYVGVNDVPGWHPEVYWRDAEVFS